MTMPCLAKNDALDLAQLPWIEEKAEVRDQPLAPTERIRAGEVLGGCRRKSRREELNFECNDRRADLN